MPQARNPGVRAFDEEREFGMLVARNVFRLREVREAAQRVGQATVLVKTMWNWVFCQRYYSKKQSEMHVSLNKTRPP